VGSGSFGTVQAGCQLATTLCSLTFAAIITKIENAAANMKRGQAACDIGLAVCLA
jgi:hypothetical protein